MSKAYENGDGNSVREWACGEWPECMCQGQKCRRDKAAEYEPEDVPDVAGDEPTAHEVVLEAIVGDRDAFKREVAKRVRENAARAVVTFDAPVSESEFEAAKAALAPYVYLAGPMTGYPSFNFPAFKAAAHELRERGYSVWSPAEQDVALDGFDPDTDEAQPFVHYMLRDLPAVMGANGVYVLEGWEASKGARLEVHVARECGIPVRDMAGDEVVDEPERENVLRTADRLTGGDRGSTYGHPADDFGRTAGMVSAMLGDKLREPITAAEWGAVMACVKLSRLRATPGHRDSLIDLAGYARTIEMVYEREGG